MTDQLCVLQGSEGGDSEYESADEEELLEEEEEDDEEEELNQTGDRALLDKVRQWNGRVQLLVRESEWWWWWWWCFVECTMRDT